MLLLVVYKRYVKFLNLLLVILYRFLRLWADLGKLLSNDFYCWATRFGSIFKDLASYNLNIVSSPLHTALWCLELWSHSCHSVFSAPPCCSALWTSTVVIRSVLGSYDQTKTASNNVRICGRDWEPPNNKPTKHL